MSHHSRVRRFRPAFDSLSTLVLPSTLPVTPPCPMDPILIIPPDVSYPSAPGDPMQTSPVLNTLAAGTSQ